MSRFTPPNDRIEAGGARAFLLLCAILFAVAVFGWFAEAQGGTVCQQVVAQPQVFAAPPAYLSYTQTGFSSNTLNLVGGGLRDQAAAQWQQENAELMAEVQAFLAARAAQKAQQQPQAPDQSPGIPPQSPGISTETPGIGSGQPPYAWAGETPTVVEHCGKCHRDGYSPEGPAGGVYLDGSTPLRAEGNWQVREDISKALADRRMPPDGHALSGELAGQILLELYAGRHAGGNPAPESDK